MCFGRPINVSAGREETWKRNRCGPNIYVTMVWAVFWDAYHTKHRCRRRHWRKIDIMGCITFFFQRLVVRDNLEECIGFLISHWNVSNVLAKYATPSWESDDRSRCFVLYSMNSELSWSDSPELGCSHFSFSCTFRIQFPAGVLSCGRNMAERRGRWFSCSFTGTKNEMFLLLVCYHFTLYR